MTLFLENKFQSGKGVDHWALALCIEINSAFLVSKNVCCFCQINIFIIMNEKRILHEKKCSHILLN